MPASADTSFDRFSQPDAGGHFGRYGGVFVPETLMTALQELGAAYEVARQDPEFQRELRHHLKEFAGRPTELYFAERLTAHGRAQDQQCPRAGPAGPAHGQEAGHRGDGRRPARGGDGGGVR
jgi:hypothetical protein